MKIQGYEHYCTVGDLKRFLETNKIPDDAKVLLQRVEDRYFEENNWKTFNKEGFHYNQAVKMNEDVANGAYDDKEQFPDIKDSSLLITPPEMLEELKDKYYVAWSPVKYEGDDNLYLDAHY